MSIDKPSKEIVAAVDGAVRWFQQHKVEGIRVNIEIDEDGNGDRFVVEDNSAPPLWARFYDLETGKPFFCDRDGIKKNTLAEISAERRNAYRWYVDDPAELLDKYPGWRKKWVKQ
jgi:pectinesterase